MRLNPKMLLGLSVMALAWGTSTAFINPAFTPVDLVKQSDLVATLEFKNVDKEGMATATVTKVLKGKMEAKEIKIDLQAMGEFMQAQGKEIINVINGGAKDSMIFVGTFPQGGGDEEGAGKPSTEERGYLHVGGKWIVVLRNKDGSWYMDRPDERMMGTWSGGTNMLERGVKYILADADAKFPVREEIEWNKEISIGKLDGKVYGSEAVDLEGKGKIDFFVAGEKGDHLFRWNGKGFDDVSAKVGLTSKSAAFAWGDFNGDGRLDLASWDGKELSILSQGADGVLSAKVVSGVILKDGCLGLTTLDLGGSEKVGKPSLLVSTSGVPLLVTVQPDGSGQQKPLASGENAGKDMGPPAECLVADFDNDGQTDVMQMFEGGGLFFKGTKPGEFAQPVKTQIGVGKGQHGMCIGDWDADGLLDIFTCSEQSNHLWHNLGGGKFVDSISLSGSVAYISKSGGSFVQTSDFANDGRQGLMMLYGASLTPQLFFNRGFRSFGLSRRLEGEMKGVPQAKDGQQAGCLADFTGVGAPSMALVLSNGETWLFPRKVDDKPLGIRVMLSLASPNAGPVTVWAGTEKRQFGAATVRAGETGMFYGAQEAGPVTVKWRFPGGEIQQKEVIVEEGTVRFMVDKAKK